MNDETADDTLIRAKGYPYAAPPWSYLFANGTAHQFVEVGADPVRDGLLRAGDKTASAAEVLHGLGIKGTPGLPARVPVLAYGSMAAPEELARIFAGVDDDVVIPVIRATLAGFDAVYAAHISPSGYIPATLEISPGTLIDIAVAFLTGPQLALMQEAEIGAANLSFGRLPGATVELDGIAQMVSVYAYIAMYGALVWSGAPTALSAVAAHHRSFAQASTAAMLAQLRDRMAPDTGIDAFILETAGDEELRRERMAELGRHARRPRIPGFEIIEG